MALKKVAPFLLLFYSKNRLLNVVFSSSRKFKWFKENSSNHLRNGKTKVIITPLRNILVVKLGGWKETS
jgi:hypothetical protein